MLKTGKTHGIIVKLLCLVLMVTFISAGAVMAEERPITVLIDGEKVEFDAQPVMKNDRVMVPVRKVFEKLGAEVLWDPFFERVIINFNETDQIVMYVNEDLVLKNGIQMKLDAAPFVSQGRTYVPLRFISENLNQSVEWSGAEYTVYIVPEHKGMQYIPFGEYLTIPGPYSVNRNYKTLEYDNKTEVAKVTYSLNGETTDDFARYTLLMETCGYKKIKDADEKDGRVIYYGKEMVITLTMPKEDGIFTVELYSDKTGDSVKEFLKGETENE